MGSFLIVILIFAWMAERPGSGLALFGLSIYLLPRVLILLNHSVDSLYLDVSYLTWILILLFMTSGQVREQEKTRRGLELRAQRLEIELLKRTIQPHFLLNTLSSVKSLLVRRPDEADELIQALASELRMIGAISSRRLISLRQELELCRYHLKIMSCRRSARYFLHTEHLPEEVKVPPLLFHSLIENGITHSFKPTEQGTFWLSSEEDNTKIRYILKNDGSLLQKLSPDDLWEEGIGIKYVKSRLEENYPGKWQLEYGLRDSKWETVITIPHP
jgi:LytS/YehU family sensor histidine kinase